VSSTRRKLIEVSLPLEAINVEAAREKSIRHGHPSTLHLWWARRPLAAARAVLFAQLVDDPSSNADDYRAEAQRGGIPADRIDGYIEGRVAAERERLHEIIRKLVLSGKTSTTKHCTGRPMTRSSNQPAATHRQSLTPSPAAAPSHLKPNASAWKHTHPTSTPSQF
jgi:hypothetical protein